MAVTMHVPAFGAVQRPARPAGRQAVRAVAVSASPSSRRALIAGTALVGGVMMQHEASAGILTKSRPKKVPIEEYSVLDNGLKYYDLEEGSGSPVESGDKVTVHFDCYLGKLDIVSSRLSALLGKNEIVPEPFTFTAGRPVSERKARKADGGQAGGSFSGMGGPKPPPALSTSVLGMKKGGKRSVIVPPEQGYGDKGIDEIPGGATIELQIEVLEL